MRKFPRTLPLVRASRFAVALGLASASTAAPAASETGRPVLRHYTPGEHLRGTDSQQVTQDASGRVIFGNGASLLTFDGVRWSDVDLPDETAGVRQFARADDGTIFVAGPGVIGRVEGTGRAQRFVSLAGELPEGARNIDELRGVAALGGTVYFSDDEKLLVWRGGRMAVIPYPTPPGSHGAGLHRAGRAVYVTARGRPLMRFEGEGMVEVADDPVLRDNRIVAVEAEAGGALTLLTAERGFFRVGADGRVARWETEMNRWLAGRRVFCALRLADGSRVVGFSAVTGDGGMRFGPDGNYLGPLDTSIGLWVKAVRGFFVDSEDGLWLGLDTGAARLEWPSPASVFDASNGLGQGAVVDVARHGGRLFAATREGLFRLEPADGAGRMARFERVAGREFFALAAHPGGLLVPGNSGVFVLGGAGLEPWLPLPPGGGALLRSRRDPDRVWVGTSRGLRAVRHAAGGWVDEGAVPQFDEHCRGLAEAADGRLWVETPERGLFRLEFADGKPTAPRVTRFAGGRGLPARLGRVTMAELAGEVVFAAAGDRVVRRFDERSGSFVPAAGDLLLTAEEAAGVQAIAPAGGGGLWVAGPDTVRRVGPERVLRHYVKATVGEVRRLWEEPGADGAVLWIAGANGLARVELAREFPPPGPFAVELTATGIRAEEALPPRHEPIGFGFVAPRQRPTSPVVYQSRLAGLDRDWLAWSARRERSFANLPAGSYRFEVRARDAEGVVTAPAVFAFEVLAPWWRTGWAWTGYVVALLAVVLAIVRGRTRTLRRRAEYLEGVVTERTAELARRNAELIRLNRLELDEKITARLGEEKARLEVLRYQLNPHFLYNTLASISATLGTASSPARRMVERLADFCRLTLHRANDSDWTTLEEEIKLLRAYLDIEQSRWGDLLDVAVEFPPELAPEKVPHFLLLPLVENALKYGHATSADRVGLRLAARREADGVLVLEVANTGEWQEASAQKSVVSLGIGLENLRERLARHYPGAHRLDLAQGGGWVTVTLRLGRAAAV